MAARIKLLIFFITATIFLFSPQKALAVTITIDNFPSSISSDAFTVGVSIAGPNPGTNYLRIDLYKEETTNYFGETFNGISWYSGSEGNQYFPVAITSEGAVLATFQGRVGSPSSSEYPGPGRFKLRIRRYTSSGNPASGDQQTPVDVQINVSIATPTPLPTSAPTPTPTKSPMDTPSPTNTPIPIPTLTSSSAKATYKINEVKDQDGNSLSSAKIYVDGIYIHHYAPEILEFCDGCKCDTHVDCGFCGHTIKLEKSGYQDWSETKTINAGDSYEANPVMLPLSSSSSSTSTPTNTLTPTKKPTSTFNLTPTPKSTARISKEASLSGEILGKDATSSTEIIRFSEATDSALATPSSKLGKKIAGIFLTLGGLSSLAAGIFLLKNKYFKKGMIKLP